MKKMLTKMLAVAMAWAMLLSCTVMASATATPDGETPQSGIGGEGRLAQGWGVTASDTTRAALQVTSAGYRNYASGEARGVSHNEGKLPSDVIRLVMPVVTSSALDMILDPHNLINATNAARYGGSSGADFKEDIQLYFLNSYGGGVAHYTEESQKLTITNKSSVPVDVNLSLRVNKGSGSDGSNFKFVSNSSGLASTTGATMYLALMSSNSDEKPVVESGNLGMHTWTAETVRALPVVVSAGTSTGKDLIGNISSSGSTSSGILQWLTSNGAVRQALLNENFPAISVEVVKASSAGEWADTPEWFDAYPSSGDSEHTHQQGISVYSNGNLIKIAVTAPTAYHAIVQPNALTSYNPSMKNVGYVLNTTKETPVSVLYYADSDTNNANPVAAVYFNLKANSLGTATVGHKAEIGFVYSDGVMPIAATAFIQDSIDAAVDAYVYGYDSKAGYYQVFCEDEPGNFATFGGDASKATYSSLSFWLKGAIGGVDKYWDVIGGDIGLNLIWDVYAAKEVILNGTKPTVTVTTKATSTGKKLVLTWTKGTQDYAVFAPDTTVTFTGGSLTMTAATTTTGGTLTNTNAYTTLNTAGASSVTVTFKATGKKPFKVTVTGVK